MTEFHLIIVKHLPVTDTTGTSLDQGEGLTSP